jgi:hypothetical protein
MFRLVLRDQAGLPAGLVRGAAAPRRSARDSASRNAMRASAPRAMKALSSPASQPARLAATSAPSRPARFAAGRSTIRSPIATPGRKTSWLPWRRNMPIGRFCSGKSVSAALADSTQDESPVSCVSSMRARVIARSP